MTPDLPTHIADLSPDAREEIDRWAAGILCFGLDMLDELARTEALDEADEVAAIPAAVPTT